MRKYEMIRTRRKVAWLSGIPSAAKDNHLAISGNASLETNDLLIGEGGSDVLNGGNGADILIGRTGFMDVLSGGAGDDTYVYKTGDGIDKIIGDDNDGKIVFDGKELTAVNAVSVIDPQYFGRPSWAWTDGGQYFYATLIDGDVTNGGTLWIRTGENFNTDRIVVENFKPGDLGLDLGTGNRCQLLPDATSNPSKTYDVDESHIRRSLVANYIRRCNEGVLL